ncbi:response regulator [Roseibium sp.]|uniref:response regulator n=1 Tax=Roseibium sp. TaxID=1936156 RepID=UPI003A977764
MTIKVLYVDDDEDIGTIVEMSLQFDPSFSVKYVSSGIEALEVVREFNPDVVLLDVMMPLMDGPTTRIRFLEDPKTATIPVIFITAKTMRSELEDLMNLGALGTIAKPFEPLELASTIKAMLQSSG